MKTKLLTDPEVFPNADVLEKAVGKTYPVLREFLEAVESDAFKFTPEWRYYRDGHAWLCKITFKNKTVVWLSVWSDCFRVALYFTEKSGKGIPDLKIQDSIKEDYLNHKAVGKLKPVIIEMRKESQLQDLYTLLRYKIGQH